MQKPFLHTPTGERAMRRPLLRTPAREHAFQIPCGLALLSNIILGPGFPGFSARGVDRNGAISVIFPWFWLRLHNPVLRNLSRIPKKSPPNPPRIPPPLTRTAHVQWLHPLAEGGSTGRRQRDRAHAGAADTNVLSMSTPRKRSARAGNPHGLPLLLKGPC